MRSLPAKSPTGQAAQSVIGVLQRTTVRGKLANQVWQAAFRHVDVDIAAGLERIVELEPYCRDNQSDSKVCGCGLLLSRSIIRCGVFNLADEVRKQCLWNRIEIETRIYFYLPPNHCIIDRLLTSGLCAGFFNPIDLYHWSICSSISLRMIPPGTNALE
jgi:hypothetical protein